MRIPILICSFPVLILASCGGGSDGGPPPATQLAITSTAPATLAPHEPFTVTVAIRTAAGDVVTTATNAVTLTLAGGGPELFWHASGGGGRITELIDPVADVVVAPVPNSVTGEMFGAVFDPSVGLLRQTNISSKMLLTDPATGDEAQYPGTLLDDLRGGVFDDTGAFHAPSPFTDVHHLVDLVSGTSTNVGVWTHVSGAVTGLTGMARHPISGVVFAIAKVTGLPNRQLCTVDLTTHVLTQVGDLGDRFSSITFTPSGALFGTTGDGATTSRTLFEIDPATAATTVAMTLTGGADGELAAFVPRRLGGTLTVNAQNGVATFSGLTLDQLGTGYTITASATGLASASQNTFAVTGSVTPTATVEFAAASSSEAENVTGGLATITLQLSSLQGHDTPVMIAIDGASTATVGGATADTTKPGVFKVTIPAGALTRSFTVSIVDDTTAEGPETLVFNIASARLATGTGANASHTLTIVSDE